MVLQKFQRSKYCLTIGPINITESFHVELLEIDKYSDFKKHIENLCWNATYKLHTLRCMRKTLAVEKAELLGNAFIDSSILLLQSGCSVRRLFILRLKTYIIRHLELFTRQMPLILIC